jgi:hypothetical protein
MLDKKQEKLFRAFAHGYPNSFHPCDMARFYEFCENCIDDFIHKDEFENLYKFYIPLCNIKDEENMKDYYSIYKVLFNYLRNKAT